MNREPATWLNLRPLVEPPKPVRLDTWVEAVAPKSRLERIRDVARSRTAGGDRAAELIVSARIDAERRR